MRSKNHKPLTKQEREHLEWVKSQPCGVCDTPAPTEAHHIEQEQHYTTIPLCTDCHRGDHNGIHGRRSIWKVKKLDELAVLNRTIWKLTHEARL